MNPDEPTSFRISLGTWRYLEMDFRTPEDCRFARKLFGTMSNLYGPEKAMNQLAKCWPPNCIEMTAVS